MSLCRHFNSVDHSVQGFTTLLVPPGAGRREGGWVVWVVGLGTTKTGRPTSSSVRTFSSPTVGLWLEAGVGRHARSHWYFILPEPRILRCEELRTLLW